LSTSRSEIFIAVALLALIGLCGGCHDPFSNQLFEDDELFIAAIPDEERVTARVPESNTGWAFASAQDGDDVGQIALYPLWTIQTASGTNEFIFLLLYLVEAITDEPISERDDDLRVWGPYPTDAGHEVTFEMTRDGDRFDYALLWDTATAEDLAPFTGSFVAGEIPREGIGNFMFDFELYEQLEPGVMDVTEGQLYVEHDNTDGQVLLDIEMVALDGPAVEEVVNARNAFFLDPSGHGWFEWAGWYNVDTTDPAVLELFEVRTRWQADGAGRADSRASGGDLEAWEYEFRATECWDSSFLRTFYGDSSELTEDQGSEGACVYPEEELPSHL